MLGISNGKWANHNEGSITVIETLLESSTTRQSRPGRL